MNQSQNTGRGTKSGRAATDLSSLQKPWARSENDVLEYLHVSSERGLDSSEVRRRRKDAGWNLMQEKKTISAWGVLANQFKSLVIILLGSVAVVSLVLGEKVQSAAIAAAILINTIIGFFTELKAVRSMESLRRLGKVTARVRRDDTVQEVHARELVPGDIVVIEGGDLVAADLRLIEASKLQADESTLTGESVPVTKGTDPCEEDAALSERTSMLFKGTVVTRGSGVGVVTATGKKTELGQVSSLVEETEDETTPLERRLNALAHRLVWVTIALVIVTATTGILAGKESLLMIETAVALAVAAIPEGLPIVATVALARGMWRMAERNALINRLSAVETLGGVNLICSDKTGTMTENHMTVTSMVIGQERTQIERSAEDNGFSDTQAGDILKAALEVGVLCNNASLRAESADERSRQIGDPLESALLIAGTKVGLDRERLLETKPEVREEAFDPEVKMMATFHKIEDSFQVAVKGAPESVLENCVTILTEEGREEMSRQDRERWMECNRTMAKEGLRVLALATKDVDRVEAEPYEELTLLGFAGLLDPPREEVRTAINLCQQAGIRVVMVTGDHQDTARNIGNALGLTPNGPDVAINGKDLGEFDEFTEQETENILEASIFARVTPKQKLGLIDLYQRRGSVVAMTGDGVNDAPALKKADIGIAMGRRGTQVAREAADMILTDDAFSSIVAAVEQGRTIFGNIRKFVLYLLSGNISEIIAVSFAAVVNAPLPILPLQILLLNMIIDVFPALALGVGSAHIAEMRKPPRDPKEPILTRNHWVAISAYGIVIAFSVLGALALATSWLKLPGREAVTVSFLTLAFARLWHVFNMRDRGSGFIHNELTHNPFIWGALGLCTGLILAVVHLPGVSAVLKVVNPGMHGWVLVISMSLIPWVVGQFMKFKGDVVLRKLHADRPWGWSSSDNRNASEPGADQHS